MFFITLFFVFFVYGYQWTDGITISPSSNNAVVLSDTVNQPALWQSNTGVRSVGLFPYNGVDITMRNQKIIPDNFDFDPTQHKFKYLSSNTLYTCLLYTSPSPRDLSTSRMPSSA